MLCQYKYGNLNYVIHNDIISMACCTLVHYNCLINYIIWYHFLTDMIGENDSCMLLVASNVVKSYNYHVPTAHHSTTPGSTTW